VGSRSGHRGDTVLQISEWDWPMVEPVPNCR
jgi:hypothetical protein